MLMTLLAVAVAVLLLNLPFGFWRGGVRKYSAAWFLAVHLPIPLIVALACPPAWAGGSRRFPS